MSALSPKETKSFYDRFGAKQDSQAFYEDRALHALVANAAFQEAQCVFEFGCGTGRFALDLLEHHLPPTAQYTGVDISSTMVRIAGERLAPFAPRASIELTPGELTLPLGDGSVDRFVATYVFDLLSDSAWGRLLAEARRVLRPNGLLCIAGITHGTTPLSRAIMTVWLWLFERNPRWVGGCRPSRAADHLFPAAWAIRFRAIVIAWGVASEVVIAAPVPQTVRV